MGDKLRAFRKRLDVSQVEFAKKIGMSARTYQDIERGITERLEADVLSNLSAMGVDLVALVSREIIDIRADYRLAEPGPEPDAGPDHGLSAAVPQELSDGELLILEFGAWVRRRLRKGSKQIDELEIAVDRLQQEVQKGRIEALKAEVLADPETWGALHLRALVMVLPAQHQKQLLEWLADQISGQADREQGPVRETAAGGE